MLLLFHLSGYAARMQEATMTKPLLEEFLMECVTADSDGDGLSMEDLYGLYLSWCGLAEIAPVGGRAFRTGLSAANVRPEHRGSRCPGLRMAGPAACDYLVRRELPLAVLGHSPGNLD